MVSFINKSVNYSETVLLKSQLAPLLRKYNDLVLAKISTSKANPFTQSTYFFVPNNNIKYYLYVTHKQRLENCRETYNILYFFPDDHTVQHVKQFDGIKQNHITDFYLEIDHRFDREYLFEGFLYQNESSNNTQTFLITDILAQGGGNSSGGSSSECNIVDCDYALRYTLVNEILYSVPGLTALNNHINIGIHPVISHESENMVSIMENNFVFASQLCSIEKIQNFTKTRVQKQAARAVSDKIITKGGFPDVYIVKDANTLDQQGILYVKGLKESKQLKHMFATCTGGNDIRIACCYNSSFNKWQPILDGV